MEAYNESLESAVKAFIESEFGDKSDRSFNNSEDVSWAVQKAYQDMQPRTIKGHTTSIKQYCCNEFAKFFSTTLEEGLLFDTLHEKLCRKFREILNEELTKKGLVPQEFGKAQKVVNMTFKYLYCFNDKSDALKQALQYAHMPLDSYTLEWYRKDLSGGRYVWSDITESDYIAIRDKIRDELKEKLSYKGIKLPESPLEAEFIVWAGEKRKNQLKELKNLIRRTANDSLFCSKLTEEDKTEIKTDVERMLQR